MRILGIETSCDETAAAVVADGVEVLSSVVASQIDLHRSFGGVVPELAARKHIEAIVPVTRAALREAGLALDQVEAVAVTQGPGLIGALLVGFAFAKALAHGLGIPWIGVNHLEGHLHSVFLDPAPPAFPYAALLVSGGHTSVYHVTAPTAAEQMGQTRDDAAGEAFDKVAKILGLGYPGGRIIDELARKGDPGKIAFPRSYLDKAGFDFSFSGLKTAVNRYVQTHPDTYAQCIPDIVAGFQEAVVDVLSFKIVNAARQRGCRQLALVGGVAANSRLRERIRREAGAEGIGVHMPSPELCGDNAAMIAAVGYHYLRAGQTSPLDADVYSRVPLAPIQK